MAGPRSELLAADYAAPMRASERIEFPGHRGHALAGRLELPEGAPRAVAIFAHCFTCSKDSPAATRISRSLAARGIAVLRFDFTGLGGSDGDFANTDFSSNVEDLVAAAAHLRGTIGAPTLLVGHSLGGAAVLVAATSIPEVRAIVTIGAPSDLEHLQHVVRTAAPELEAQGQAEVELAGRRFRMRREFLADLAAHDLPARLRRLGRAVLVMHSPVDEIVDVDHARRLYEALRHPKSFVSLDDANHLLTVRRDAEYAAELLAAWASRYVGESTREDGAGEADEVLAPGVVTVRGGGAPFVQRIRAGRHRLVADEPRTVPGGTDLGPDPYALVLAGLGACTAMTLQLYARRKGWPLAGVQVDVWHERVHAEDCADCDAREAQPDRFQRVLRLEGPLDDAQRARLLEIAERCPVHRTLERPAALATSLASDRSDGQPG